MGVVIQRLLAAIYGVWSLIAASSLGATLGLLLLPFVFLPRGKRERYAIVPATWWAHAVIRGVLFARPRVTGSPPDTEGALVVCNHRSWLDPVLLMAYLRSNGLSKKEIFYLPFIGLYGWLAGAVFFDRTSKKDRARARDEVMMLVRNGFRIQLFPEGTRSRTGELKERVFLRLVKDCWEEDVPVLPCAVMDTDKALPATHFGAYVFQEPRLDIGELYRPGDFDDSETFADAVWSDVTRRVAALSDGTPGDQS